MPAVKPKLEKLATPVAAAFPSEIASASTATPLSAVHLLCKPDPDSARTPISPPSAYTDFLSRAMSLGSPAVPSDASVSSKAGDVPASAASGPSDVSSSRADDVPASAASDPSDVSSSKADDSSAPSSPSSSRDSPPTTGSAAVPPSPYPTPTPMSAPPAGAASFPSLKLPPSPAVSSLDSPLSASAVRSPFSARSVRPVFDWDAALKARFSDLKKHKPPRTSVRHIREVVTRTVTYTPKMEPAPRGKRRKVE